MNKRIVLNQMRPSFGEVSNKIIRMLDNEDGIKDIFKGKYSLIYSAELSAIIESNGKEIGFVNLRTPHESTTNTEIFHVDIGIKKDYRNEGYSKKVISELQKIYQDAYFLGETREDNTPIIRIGKEIASYDDIKVLLLGNYSKKKIEDFYRGDSSLFSIIDTYFLMKMEERKENISINCHYMKKVLDK